MVGMVGVHPFLAVRPSIQMMAGRPFAKMMVFTIPKTESMKDNSIHFFNSLEEMSDDHYSYLATLSPEQHLQNALIHIKQIYADELLKNPDSGKEIIFDSI